MTVNEINDAAAALHQKYGGNRGPVLRKPVSVEPVLDGATVLHLEAFAGEHGYTMDEAVAIWLDRHATICHYY